MEDLQSGDSSGSNRRISVFIPVYRDSDLLEELLEGLVNDSYQNREIFVIIDEPTADAYRVIERFRDKVHFILNDCRRGKVEALNEAVRASSGEILVFLDADVRLGECRNFLRTIALEMDGTDILDIKKKIIKDSFLSRMVYYEFVGSNFSSFLYSKLVQKCFAVGGMAFAIKRETFEEVDGFAKVASEDFDLAARAFFRNKRFKFTSKAEVYTKAPSKWRSWLAQRKRWGIGTGLWIKTHGGKVVRYIVRYPYIAFPCFLMLFPTVALMLFNHICSLFPDVQLFNLIPRALASQLNLTNVPMLPPSITSILFTTLTNFFLGFIMFSIIFYTASRKLKFRFSFAEFIAYYFFYQPISFLVLFAGIIAGIFFKDHKIDWKL
ncbi:glycosyltransferase family 2 protein [Candidatus Bathyarchaeota archaeon]|nr:glycosyltransferase family 2 protein [Candidatus Bathyarchaeota archaeon]